MLGVSDLPTTETVWKNTHDICVVIFKSYKFSDIINLNIGYYTYFFL